LSSFAVNQHHMPNSEGTVKISVEHYLLLRHQATIRMGECAIMRNDGSIYIVTDDELREAMKRQDARDSEHLHARHEMENAIRLYNAQGWWYRMMNRLHI
jgi:hypothetical protein